MVKYTASQLRHVAISDFRTGKRLPAMPEEPQISPTLSVFSLLRESYQVLVANFSLICLLGLTFSVPGSLITNYFFEEVYGYDLETSDSLGSLLEPLAIFFFISIVIYPLQSGAVVYAVAKIYQGQAAVYKEAILVGFLRWPYLMPAYLITTILSTLGFVLLLIPGVLVMIYFALIDQEIVLAQGGTIEGLRNSAKMVKGNGWLVLGVFASIFVPEMVLSGAIGYLMGAIPALDNIWFETLSSIPLVILSSLSFIALTIFYFRRMDHSESS